MPDLEQSLKDLVSTNLRDDTSLRSESMVQSWLAQFQSIRNQLPFGNDTELLDLVDGSGQLTGVSAPRWLCHLLALRHAVVHVVLRVETAATRMLLLQVRSWSKNDSPGCLDVSVGGHVKRGDTTTSTAASEMAEETGFTLGDLVGQTLRKVHTYRTYDSTGSWFHNSEWCEVYAGEVLPAALPKLAFNDGEVAGVYLCPIDQAQDLLNRSALPVASALRNFLSLESGLGL